MSPPLELILIQFWEDALRPFGTPADTAGEAYLDLIARYTEPGRFYHNLTHLCEVLRAVESFQTGSNDLTGVHLAAWFHDAVYDSRASDNEERSARLAEAVLPGLGVPPDTVAAVSRLVQLTKAHDAPPGDADAAVLLDSDLAILGARARRYDQYARDIRREYAWVPKDQFIERRARVLRGFLGRERIYRTERLYRAREGPARANLRRELDALA
jgi:predicted metal-dependent HD superfamily phosphohydrolase